MASWSKGGILIALSDNKLKSFGHKCILARRVDAFDGWEVTCRVWNTRLQRAKVLSGLMKAGIYIAVLDPFQRLVSHCWLIQLVVLSMFFHDSAFAMMQHFNYCALFACSLGMSNSLQQWLTSDRMITYFAMFTANSILMDWDGPRWWWGMWPQTSSQGSVVLVWRFGQFYIVSILARLFFFCSVAFIGFYSFYFVLHRFLLDVNWFCFHDNALFNHCSRQPPESDTFNFSGVPHLHIVFVSLCSMDFCSPRNPSKSDALALRHRPQRRRRHIKVTKYRAFSRLDRSVLSGTWFEGLGKADLAMLADSRLSQNETWKKCIKPIFLMD